MRDESLEALTLAEAARLIARKKLSPLELTQAALDRIESLNAHLNAFLIVTAERAIAAARNAERAIVHGRARGPLHGIPIALKDNIKTRGIRTTAGSRILANHVPDEDATVWRRLKRSGAILLGKTSMHEFALGISSENPHYGPVRNPWATERIAGGSSGGSAAAVATSMCFASVGTDTGGSIRIPAAMCGVVGLKPTYGRVSMHGIVPLARSMDHAGPLARTAEDVAIVLAAIAGRDVRDPASVAQPVPDFAADSRKPLRPMRIGMPTDYFFERVSPEIAKAIELAAAAFMRLGGEILEIRLASLATALAPATDVALVEALDYHESQGWFPGRAGEYGEDVRKLLERGRDVRAISYLRAAKARHAAQASFEEAFENVEAILAPAVPVTATRIGEKLVRIGDGEETVRSALLRLNRPANFTGLPAISIPCGFDSSGLPIGLQIIAPAWAESRLLRMAVAYERVTDWHLRRPKI